MKIDYSSAFKKQFKKLPSKIQSQFEKRLILFLESPKDPRLRVHKLSGSYKNLYSFNVSGDVRAIFDRKTMMILFITIGSHSELYG